jgi:hypothetical protein
LRKEREAHGYLQMDPSQGWPAPMHEIWQADRARLGAGTAVAAVVGAGAALATGAGVGVAVLAVALWAPAVGFLIAALFSLLRLQAFDAAAATASLPGLVLFFVVACVGLAGSLILSRRRTPIG